MDDDSSNADLSVEMVVFSGEEAVFSGEEVEVFSGEEVEVFSGEEAEVFSGEEVEVFSGEGEKAVFLGEELLTRASTWNNGLKQSVLEIKL